MNVIYVHDVEYWPPSERQCVLVTCPTINFIGSCDSFINKDLGSRNEIDVTG